MNFFVENLKTNILLKNKIFIIPTVNEINAKICNSVTFWCTSSVLYDFLQNYAFYENY